MTLSPETLSAFLDGELDPKKREQVERALARDDSARRQLQKLRRGSAILRAALNEPLSEPVPDRVLALLDRTGAEPTKGSTASAAPPTPASRAVGCRPPWPPS